LTENLSLFTFTGKTSFIAKFNSQEEVSVVNMYYLRLGWFCL